MGNVSRPTGYDASILRTQDPFMSEVCDLANLQAALDRAEKEGWDTGEELQPSAEEWLINLQNHLLWGTKSPDADGLDDFVALIAITLVCQRHGITPSQVEGQAARLLAYITPEQGGGDSQ